LGKIPTIENLFFDILTYSYLLFPIIFFFKLSRLKIEKTFSAIVVYSFFFFLVLVLDPIIPQGKIFTKLYYALWTLIEYVFFALIISQNIQNKRFKNLILVLSLVFISFQAFYFFGVQNVKLVDTIPMGIESILIFIFCFYFFYEQLRDVSTPIYTNFFFWVALGLILYLSGSFFIYILSNVDRQMIRKYWFITYILDTVKNVFFVTSGLVFLKQTKYTSTKTVLPNLDFN
jgi:hypothetical protein